MEDSKIVQLYWDRDERAIARTSEKYGRYCYAVSHNILHSGEDAEECLSDMYLKAWNAMPPHLPACLRTFLGKIIRNLSLNRYEKMSAEKRGRSQIPLLLDELSECIPDGTSEDVLEEIFLRDLLDRFLAALPPETCNIFVRRYWHMHSIAEIARMYGMTESRVKVTLFRTREQLKTVLTKEGVSV